VPLAQRLSHLALWRSALRVLCYHRVLPDVNDRFTVTTSAFESQLAYLRGAGFAFVRLTDLRDSKMLPRKPVLLTFDDGYLDNLEHAQPRPPRGSPTIRSMRKCSASRRSAHCAGR
jgi:hypothetical protein